MDAKTIFALKQSKIMTDYEASKEMEHSVSKGSIRESIINNALIDTLPTKYAFGDGSIISSSGSTSRQCDIVLYPKDCSNPFRIANGPSHFPIEFVYAALEIKSVLSARELRDAYRNIVSIKSLAPKTGFNVYGPGTITRLYPAMPVGVVVAFEAGRSLESVANQMSLLDAEAEDSGNIKHRPDCIVIMNNGIIAPKILPIRKSKDNIYDVKISDDLCEIYRTKQHTLLSFINILSREMGNITLPPFDLSKYILGSTGIK